MTATQAKLTRASCGSAQPIPEIPEPTDKEFALFQELVSRESGIHLSFGKKAMVVSRLSRRVRDLGLNSMGAYYEYLVQQGDEERTRMLDCICTNETRFFRETQHFEFLERAVFPEWSSEWASGARDRIRLWSAACSTGEEAYSLAMMLCEYFPPGPGRAIEILASDISTKALETARAGVWPLPRSEEIPTRHLKRFMLKGTEQNEGKMKAGPEIRSLIKFHRINLNDSAYPVAGSFDLIMCRNALIYFDGQSKARAINRLLDHLAPSGYFVMGLAESLHGLTDRVRNIAPAIYVRINSEVSRLVSGIPR